MLVCSCARVVGRSCGRALVGSFVRLFVCSCGRALVGSFVRLLVCPCVLWFVFICFFFPLGMYSCSNFNVSVGNLVKV